MINLTIYKILHTIKINLMKKKILKKQINQKAQFFRIFFKPQRVPKQT